MDDSKTWLKEKDAPLEETVAKILQACKNWNIELCFEKELEAVPGLWSVHLSEKKSGFYTNGKGTSLLAAQASALGEFCERLGTAYFFSNQALVIQKKLEDFYFAPDEVWAESPKEILNDELWDFFFPKTKKDGKRAKDLMQTLALPLYFAAADKDLPQGILSLPFSREGGKTPETVQLPVNILWNLYASNGMAAGNTQEEAEIQGLSEIFERYVRFKVLKDGLCLPDIPEDSLSDQEKNIVKAIEKEGFSVLLKSADLAQGFPVISVALIHQASSEVLLSFGAHPSFHTALLRTLSELFQGRKLMHAQDFSYPEKDLDLTGDPGNLENHFINSTGLVPMRFFEKKADYAFKSWKNLANRQEERDYLYKLVDDLGKKVYLRRNQALGLEVCHIVVPGISEVYPLEDLLDSNTNRYADFLPVIFAGESLKKNQFKKLLEKALDNLEEAYYAESLESLFGIALGGSPWEGSVLAEILLLLYWVNGEYEELQTFLDYYTPWNALRTDKRRFWRSVQYAVQNNFKADTGNHIYQSETLQELKNLRKSWPAQYYPSLQDCMNTDPNIDIKKSQVLLETWRALQRTKA